MDKTYIFDSDLRDLSEVKEHHVKFVYEEMLAMNMAKSLRFTFLDPHNYRNNADTCLSAVSVLDIPNRTVSLVLRTDIPKLIAAGAQTLATVEDIGKAVYEMIDSVNDIGLLIGAAATFKRRADDATSVLARELKTAKSGSKTLH